MSSPDCASPPWCPWCRNTGTVAGDGCVACASWGGTLADLEAARSPCYREECASDGSTLATYVNLNAWGLLRLAIDNGPLPEGTAPAFEQLGKIRVPWGSLHGRPVMPSNRGGDDPCWLPGGGCSQGCVASREARWPNTEEPSASTVTTECSRCSFTDREATNEFLWRADEGNGLTPCLWSLDGLHRWRGEPSLRVRALLAARRTKAADAERKRHRRAVELGIAKPEPIARTGSRFTYNPTQATESAKAVHLYLNGTSDLGNRAQRRAKGKYLRARPV